MRVKRLGSALMGAIVVVSVSIAPGWASGANADPGAPYDVVVTSPDLTATVAWTPADAAGLVGYRVEVDDMDTGARTALRTVDARDTSVLLTGLPRWDEQIARVTAVFDDGSESSSDWSDSFRVLSTLILDNDDPLFQTGDGVCCETYVVERGFHLDAPMPIDVWISPTAVAYDGSSAHDGYDQTDPLWPAATDSMPIKIPAGKTHGTYQILYWGDDWKRFEYVHDTFGFESVTYPAYSPGIVHLADARQEFTLYEDDPYFWPDVVVDPETDVTAGRTAKVRIRLNRTAHHDTVLSYVVKDGSARGGRDYTAVGHNVTVAKGRRVVFVHVPTTQVNGRGTRTFTVRVTKVKQQMAHLTGRSASTVRIASRH